MRARQGRWMPRLSDNGDPRGTVVKDMQIESHEDVNKRWDAVFRDPRAVSGRQEDPLMNECAATGAENAGRNTRIIRIGPDNRCSHVWEQVLNVDVTRNLGAGRSKAHPKSQRGNDQSAHL